VQLHELQGPGSFEMNDPDANSNVRVIVHLKWWISYDIQNIEDLSQVSTDDLSPSLWQGTCIHDFKTPKWVQKRRANGADGPETYDEPRRAMVIAMNSKFSVVAIGTQRYALVLLGDLATITLPVVLLNMPTFLLRPGPCPSHTMFMYPNLLTSRLEKCTL
jgi:hypothetical protein